MCKLRVCPREALGGRFRLVGRSAHSDASRRSPGLRDSHGHTQAPPTERGRRANAHTPPPVHPRHDKRSRIARRHGTYSITQAALRQDTKRCEELLEGDGSAGSLELLLGGLSVLLLGALEDGLRGCLLYTSDAADESVPV